jgi:hypothetical protein
MRLRAPIVMANAFSTMNALVWRGFPLELKQTHQAISVCINDTETQADPYMEGKWETLKEWKNISTDYYLSCSKPHHRQKKIFSMNEVETAPFARALENIP